MLEHDGHDALHRAALPDSRGCATPHGQQEGPQWRQWILLEGEKVALTNNPDTWVYRASLHHFKIISSLKICSSQTAPDTWVYRASLHLGIELLVPEVLFTVSNGLVRFSLVEASGTFLTG